MATPARQADPQHNADNDAAEHEIIGVMDADSVHMSTGHRLPLRSPALGDGALYTFMLARRACQLNIAQLWIHPSWPGVLDDDVPEHLTRQYGVWRIGTYSPHWRTALRVGPAGDMPRYTTAIVLPGLDDRAPWREASSAEELLEAITRYRTACGLSYRRHPGLTGIDLIRDVHGYARDGKRKPGARGRPLRLDVPGTLPEPCTNNVELPRKWMRTLTEGERRAKYLHSFDKNAMYLAACSSLALGVGEPVHTRPGDGRYDELAHPLDEKTGKRLPRPPAFWRVHFNPDRLPILHGFPSPVRPPSRGQSQQWITTPTLELLNDLDAEADVTEAYIWPTHHRALEQWCTRLRGARARLMYEASEEGGEKAGAALALDIVKLTYQMGSGYLGYPGTDEFDRKEDTLYRPDWRNMMIAAANSVVFRQGLKCVEDGYFPWALGMDCWYFVSDEPDPIKACPPALKLGDGLGAWKVKDAAVPLEEVLGVIDAAQGRYGALQLVQQALNARRHRLEKEEQEGA